MGMTIEVLTKYKQNLLVRNKGQVSEKSVAECSNLTMDEVIDSIDVAVDIVRKYQKIQEIVKAWNDMNSFDSMVQISEVIEDE